MNATDTTPRIYVASLADYNAGRLHGCWIDCDNGADAIQEAVNEMLAASPEPNAEEWAIHDYEGFCGLTIHEYDSFQDVADKADMIAKHGPAFAAYAEWMSGDITEEDFEESYCGEWESEQHYAEDLADDVGMFANAPETLCLYFDWDKWTQDLFMTDYHSIDSPNGVYVFRNI